MSISLMTEAWKANMPSGCKFVLLSLCDNANDQGECFPSISMIAQRCSMSERAVQGHIKALELAGILRRVERMGRSTIYLIDPRRICTPAESAPPQNLHPTPAESAPITINEPSIETKEKQNTARPLARPADVSPQVWADFLALRKAKRANLTQTALDGLRTEARQAGVSLDDALSVCCVRGWQGFKAEWLTGRQPSHQPRTATQQPESFAEREARAKRQRWEQMTGRKWPDDAPADATPTVIDVEAATVQPPRIAQ